MNFEEKSRILRRITLGKTTYIINPSSEGLVDADIPIIFHDPKPEILYQADLLCDQWKNSGKEKGIMTLEDSIELLREDGRWTIIDEANLDKLTKDLKCLKAELPNLKFHKLKLLATKEKIKEIEIKINDLSLKKYQLYSSTLEYLVENNRKRFIISKITEIDENYKYLLSNSKFIDFLAVYYNRGIIQEDVIREIARSDPWRLYWIVSKDSGNSLFPFPITEITELQYLLLLWSRIYDFAFESLNSPSNDVISDNDLFDQWYNKECERINSEKEKRSISDGKGQELYIPADREGAKDVYKLNSASGQRLIKDRFNTIEKKGVVKHHDLPDVKLQYQMELNNMALKRGQKNG